MSTNLQEFGLHEAARRLGVSEITVRRMLARGEIAHYRIGSRGGRIRFTDAHLQEYRERRTFAVAA